MSAKSFAEIDTIMPVLQIRCKFLPKSFIALLAKCYIHNSTPYFWIKTGVLANLEGKLKETIHMYSLKQISEVQFLSQMHTLLQCNSSMWHLPVFQDANCFLRLWEVCLQIIQWLCNSSYYLLLNHTIFKLNFI